MLPTADESSEPTNDQNLRLDRFESYFYWFFVVKAPFVLVTNGSKEKMPTEAYFFPIPEDENFFPTIQTFEFLASGISGWQRFMHALKISIEDVSEEPGLQTGKKISFYVSVVHSDMFSSWSDGIVFGSDDTWPVPMMWHNSLWENCTLSIPPSISMRKEIYAVTKGKIKPRVSDVTDLGTSALFLFLAMMDRYWKAQKEFNPEVQAREAEGVGISGTHSASSIRIQGSRIGLRKPILSKVKDEINLLKKRAAKIKKSNADARFEAKVKTFSIPNFFVPDSFKSKIVNSTPSSYDEHIAERLTRIVWPRAKVASPSKKSKDVDK